jgi:fructokinase
MNGFAVVIGETLVDLIDDHEPDGALVYRPRYGGSPFNVAVGAARLGARVELATAFGADTFGQQARAFLAAEGVGTSLASTTPGGTCLAVVTTLDGQASYEYFGQFEAMTDIAELDAGDVAKASLVHAGCTATYADPARSTVRRAFAAATGFRSLDPNPRPTLIPDRDDYRRHLLDLTAAADLIKVSQEDVRYIWGDRPLEEAIAELRNSTPGVVIVTRADQDTLVYSGGEQRQVPVPLTVVADPTGAGDSFMACLIARIVADGVPASVDDWADVARRASVAASITCSRIGGAEAMPTRAELRRRDQALSHAAGRH